MPAAIAYIACLNNRELSRLGDFVADDVVYNDERIGLERYRQMIAGDYEAIPDLHFDVQMLVADRSTVITGSGSLPADGFPAQGASCGITQPDPVLRAS